MNNQHQWDVDGAWSIGLKDYETLLSHVDTNASNVIVELGSGNSTLRLAEDMRRSQLFSLEDDPEIAEQNNKKLQSENKHSACIVLAPIVVQFFRGAVFSTYDIRRLPVTASIDLLIVDGPVEARFPRGREAALYFLFDKLAIGAIIGLDDYHRPSARTTVVNWLTVFGEALEIVEETASFAVLRKRADIGMSRLPLTQVVDSYSALWKSVNWRISRALKETVRTRSR